MSRYAGPQIYEEVDNLAWIYRKRIFDYGKALELYLHLLRQYPQHEKAIETEGDVVVVYLEMGSKEMADSRLKNLLAAYAGHPSLSLVLNDIGEACRRHGYYADSIQIHEAVLATNPVEREKYEAYAGIAKTKAQISGAKDSLEVDAMIQQLMTEYKDTERLVHHIIEIGEEYYQKGQKASGEGNAIAAKTAYEEAIDILLTAQPILPNDHERCLWSYMMGLIYWQLGDWSSASAAFYDAIEAEPGYMYAGSIHWLISDCYEKLKRDGIVDAAEADPAIEWGYQTLFDSYPDSRDVAYAAMRLGEINLARGKPVAACVYFNWFMDYVHAGSGQFPDINRILARLKECGQ